MDQLKLAGWIGLCMRARQLALGTDQALKAVRGGKAALILMDAGASDNLRKKLSDACVFRRVPCVTVPSGWIGDSCGGGDWMAVSVRKGGLADSIIRLAGEQEKPRQ